MAQGTAPQVSQETADSAVHADDNGYGMSWMFQAFADDDANDEYNDPREELMKYLTSKRVKPHKGFNVLEWWKVCCMHRN